MTKELMDDDIRYLRKWLNEENTSPVDRVALATVLHEVVDLRDRMGGSEGLHRINAHKIKFLKDQLAAAQAEIAHWKNNHETEVRRARILKERTDMPIERVQAYEKWGEDQRTLAASQAHIKVLWAALENCRLLAARYRKEEWAPHILRFCESGGSVANPLRQDDSALRELLKAGYEAQLKVMREALTAAKYATKPSITLEMIEAALAQPTDDSALRFVAIIEKRTIERCAVAADKAYATDEVIAAIRKLGEQE